MTFFVSALNDYYSASSYMKSLLQILFFEFFFQNFYQYKSWQTSLFSVSNRYPWLNIHVVPWSALFQCLSWWIILWFTFDCVSCGTFGVVSVAPVDQQGAELISAATGNIHLSCIHVYLVNTMYFFLNFKCQCIIFSALDFWGCCHQPWCLQILPM